MDYKAWFMSRVALVDDDANTLVFLSERFRNEGYDVATFTNGAEALSALYQDPVDIVVLDDKMPIMGGKEMLTRLRENSDVPVIFLTARNEQKDEEESLRLGADDYIRKPFSLALLLLRTKNILKRCSRPLGGGKDSSIKENSIIRGDLLLDMDRHDCTWKGKNIHLTVTEFQILQSLAKDSGRVKSRSQLMNAAYLPNINVLDRNIDYHIRRIRNKFKNIDPNFDMIETVHCIGYAFREQSPRI